MCIAKLKTATVVLCGAAVLGLGTGGVLYQTRAGAADPQNVERAVQDRPKRGIDAGQEKDKWRQIAEEAQAREKKLQAELERLRAELAELRRQADLHRSKAEDKRLRAEEALNAARRFQGRLDAFRTPDRKREANADLEKVETTRDQVICDFKKRIGALQDQRQKLEMEQKKLEEVLRQELTRLDKMKSTVLEAQAENQPKPKEGQPRGSGDKLDRILERLKRLEKRLDRLEQGRR